MNNFKAMVRVGKDLETFKTKSEKQGVKLLLTIPRPYNKNRDESAQDADFINAVAFGATAEFLIRNVEKGTRMVVDGSIRSDRYQKDGQNRYSMPYVLIDEILLVDFKNNEKKTDSPQTSQKTSNNDDGWGADVPF